MPFTKVLEVLVFQMVHSAMWEILSFWYFGKSSDGDKFKTQSNNYNSFVFAEKFHHRCLTRASWGLCQKIMNWLSVNKGKRKTFEHIFEYTSASNWLDYNKQKTESTCRGTFFSSKENPYIILTLRSLSPKKLTQYWYKINGLQFSLNFCYFRNLCRLQVKWQCLIRKTISQLKDKIWDTFIYPPINNGWLYDDTIKFSCYYNEDYWYSSHK